MRTIYRPPPDELVAPPVTLAAVTYGRVSTDQQEMDRQDRELNDYCSRRPFNVLTRLSDPDVSGSIPMRQREGGAELMGLIQRIPGLQIITTEQDRIGRDTIDQILTIRAIWESGGTPHFVLEGGPLPRTDENEHRMEMRASDAQYERNKIRSRIRSKMHGKREANELCGTVTFGWNVRYHFADDHQVVRATAYTQLDRKLVERDHGRVLRTEMLDNPDEQKWIRHMIQRRREQWTDFQIATELNRLGVKSKNAGLPLPGQPGRFVSGKWQAQQVAKLLSSTTVQQWLVDH